MIWRGSKFHHRCSISLVFVTLHIKLNTIITIKQCVFINPPWKNRDIHTHISIKTRFRLLRVLVFLILYSYLCARVKRRPTSLPVNISTFLSVCVEWQNLFVEPRIFMCECCASAHFPFVIPSSPVFRSTSQCSS